MGQTTPQELDSFFTYVVEVMERLQIPYMVAGGFAAIFYGEPRLTIVIDIVTDIKPQHIKTFIEAFPFSNYYLSEEAIRDSLQRRYPFNVIETTTGAKADIIPYLMISLAGLPSIADEKWSTIPMDKRHILSLRRILC